MEAKLEGGETRTVKTTEIKLDSDISSRFPSVTEVIESTILIDSTSKGFSSLYLDRTHDDLSNYKKRIDANIEQQREHADIMADLQRKVEDYRRRFANMEDKISEHKVITESYELDIPSAKTREELFWSPKLRMIDDIGDEDMENQLFEERKRNEDMLAQLEQERIHNGQLRAEIQRMRKQYEISMKDKERIFINRERNIAQHLSDEQRRIMELWAELKKVRKQCAEYKEQTERDLENQKNEFTKVMRNVTGAINQLGFSVGSPEGSVIHPLVSDEHGEGRLDITRDVTLIEAVRRFHEGRETLAPQIIHELRTTKADDYGAQNEIMRKYEEGIQRIHDLEARYEGDQGKVINLETDLKRTRDRLNDAQNALRKLYDLAREFEQSPDSKKRTRSWSPDKGMIPSSEVVRTVRYVLNAKTNDALVLQRKLNGADAQMAEILNNYRNSEDARRRLEKQISDLKKELADRMENAIENERKLKNTELFIKTFEAEKINADNIRRKLEDEIRRLNESHSKHLVDMESRYTEDADERYKSLEDDYRARIAELTRRIEGLIEENKRLKNEANDFGNKYKNVEEEYKVIKQKLEDKDKLIRNLESAKDKLRNELDEQRSRFDAVTNQLDSLKSNFDNASQSSGVFEITIKELKQQRYDIMKQKDDLASELGDLKQNLANEIKGRDDARKAYQRQLSEIDKMKVTISEYESRLNVLQRQNDDLETQLNTNKARTNTLENLMQSTNKDKEKLNELNQKLIKEKSEVLIMIQRTETDTSALKDKISKLEQEIANLKAYNRNLEDNERKATDAYNEQLIQIQMLQGELDEARKLIEKLSKKPEVAHVQRDERKGAEHGDQKIILREDTTIYEITNAHIRETEDRWKIMVEKVENERDTLARQIESMQDLLDEKQSLLDRQDAEISDLRARLKGEMDKMKVEMNLLQNKYSVDFEDDKNQYAQQIDSLNITIEDLRNKLSIAENKLNDAQNRDAQLSKDLKDLKEKNDAVNNQLIEVREKLRNAQDDAAKELARLQNELFTCRNDLKAYEGDNNTLKMQLTSAEESNKSLNKTINDQAAKIRDLNSNVRRLGEEMADLKSSRDSISTDLENALNRLRSTEEQYDALKRENSKIQSEYNALLKEYEMLKGDLTSREAEIDRLTKKLQQVLNERSEQMKVIEQLRFERDRIQNAYGEKSKQTENLNHELQNLDGKLGRIRVELTETTDRLAASDSERDALRAELKRLDQQLNLNKDQMVRKTSEYQKALDDLTEAHRTAEDGRVNAVHELEYCKLELGDLQTRLDNTDQYLINIKQNYMRSENERDRLADALRRFQSVVNRSITISRFQKIAEGEKDKDTDGRSKETITLQTSSDDGKEDKQFDLYGLDLNLRTLMAKVQKLELERNEYKETLDRQSRKGGDMSVTTKETIYRTVDAEGDSSDKRALELRLESAKQLLRSQEEALKQRDEERRDLKNKLVGLEMQIRSKDAQIRHLNDLVRNLKSDLNTAQADVRLLRDREEQWDTYKFHIESKLKDQEGESKKISLLSASFDNDRQTLSERVNKLMTDLQQSENKYNDLLDDVERLKRDLARSEKMENEYRIKVEQQTRIQSDNQIIRDQLTSAENEITGLNSRKQQLENELLLSRSEAREHKQRLTDANHRTAELQRQIEDIQSDKKRLNDRIEILEKNIANCRAAESDVRQQLSNSMNEKNSLEAELSELQRRLLRYENEKRILNDKNDELEKNRIIFLQRITILENDKRAIEAIVTDTALQREAIEQSLNALERENKELHRNCAQLQQQIAQLELENGNRLISLTSKQRDEHEKFVKTVVSEKMQIERVIENRERVFRARIKQLEAQLNSLRDQLFNERRRRRDFTDKILVSDVGQINSNINSLYTGIIPSETLDSTIYSSFTSYGSPWFDYSLTGDEYTKIGSTVIKLEDSDITTYGLKDFKKDTSGMPMEGEAHSYSITRKEESGGLKGEHVTEESIILEPSKEIEESEFRGDSK